MSEAAYVRLVDKQKQALAKLEERNNFLVKEYERLKLNISELEIAQESLIRNRFARDKLIIQSAEKIERFENLYRRLSMEYDLFKIRISELEQEKQSLLMQLMKKNNSIDEKV